MKVGIIVPQFRHDPTPALHVARRAEAVGLDGVFVFDHLWPLHQPQRPSLYSLALLGALAAETSRVELGPLVARVSVLPNAVLVRAMETLRGLVGERLIVGLGAGDHGNRDENLAYGVEFPPVERRLSDLVACSCELRSRGLTTWVGGRSRQVMRAAAAADGWNGWGYPDAGGFARAAAEVRREVSAAGGDPELELSWGGQVLTAATEEQVTEKLARHRNRPGLVAVTVEGLADHLRGLARAGAAWAVCAPLDVGTDPAAVEMVAEAAKSCR